MTSSWNIWSRSLRLFTRWDKSPLFAYSITRLHTITQGLATKFTNRGLYSPKTAGGFVYEGCFVRDDIRMLHAGQVSNFGEGVLLLPLASSVEQLDDLEGVLAPIVLVDHLVHRAVRPLSCTPATSHAIRNIACTCAKQKLT